MEALVPLWISSTFCALGVIYAIARNGTRGKKQDEQLKTELKSELGTIKEKLDDPDTGLTAIKKSVDEQKVHCAKVSTGIAVQVKTNSVEINTLRKK